ncbi:MAG: hypothetical protein A3J24_00750 [Deltaproteobacteria bacterium RIFCSPLOWO2_02_FULL_53_8]|nr:MAG: hypothetical protein A3J24_00750 [Deltaproteobacteria bacterium RIFCSPLOWO2_02_FULL_53_8]
MRLKARARVILLIAAVIFSVPVVSHGLNNKAAGPGATAVIGSPVSSYTLFDQTGASFDFPFQQAEGKAVVVNFIYTDCGHVCPLVVQHLADAYKKAGSDFGNRFIALTVGLDTERDTPAHLAGFGKRFAKDPEVWRFASSDAKTIAAMTKELGVYYKKTKDGFEHANIVTVIGPDRRIFAQVYGPAPTPDEILKPVYASLRPSASGSPVGNGRQPVTLLDRLRLLCYTYDPATGEYKADYGFIVVIGIGIFAWGIGIYIIRHIIRGARQASGGNS